MEATGDQSAFWNAAAQTRLFTHPLDATRFSRAVARDAHILDYGCGQGRLCGELVALGFTRVVGIDSSPEMVHAARQRNPGASFAVNDGARLPCADASLDAALLFAVLTCIPDDAAQKNLLGEFKRSLRPGGLLLISDYPLQTDARNLARYLKFAPGAGYGTFQLPDGAWLRHHRREWFDEVLEGFRVEDSVELEALTMNGNRARILQLWARRQQ